jgi:hypothetical protein
MIKVNLNDDNERFWMRLGWYEDYEDLNDGS